MIKNNKSLSVCILRLSSIGDITHILPIIATIKNAYPDADITWIIGKTEYQLVKNIDYINFLVVDKNKAIDSLVTMNKLCGRQIFDVVLHMQKSLRSKFIGKLLRGRININYSDIEKENVHVLDHFFSFLEKININKRVIKWDTKKLLNKSSSNIEKRLEDISKFISINPFTSERINNYREWNYSNYVYITEYLKNKYSIHTIFIGKTSNKNKESFEKLFSNNDSLNFINSTSLIETLYILKKSLFYIGPDSGTLHMANMFNIPIIGLYATSNPDRTGPYKNQKFNVNKYNQALLKFNDKKIIDANWGERVRDANAMRLITKAEVIEKIDEIMK